MQGGIMRLDGDEFVYAGPEHHSMTFFPAGPISFSPEGELVTGGMPVGVFMFDGAVWHYWEAPFNATSPVWGRPGISAITVTEDQDIWVGTWGVLDADGDGLWVLRREAKTMPIFLGVEVDCAYVTGPNSQRVLIDMLNSVDRTVDVYVALELANGSMYFYPSFDVVYTPYLTGINIPAETHLEDCELFTIWLPELPVGTYRWYAAFTHTGTMDFASNIASCEWKVE